MRSGRALIDNASAEAPMSAIERGAKKARRAVAAFEVVFKDEVEVEVWSTT